jgi:hypothetical protein
MKSATPHELFLLSSADVAPPEERQAQPSLPGLSRRQKAAAAAMASMWTTLILTSVVLGFTSRTDTVSPTAATTEPMTASAALAS